MVVGPYQFQITLTARCRIPRGAKPSLLRASEAALKGIPKKVLQKKLKKGRVYLVHLTLVTSKEMKALNKQYRGKNYVTDVLSFSRLEGHEMPHPEVGDVIICGARAREQAPEWNNTLMDELSRLTVHGILHLFGFDHERSAKDEHLMFRLQDQILFTLPR